MITLENLLKKLAQYQKDKTFIDAKIEVITEMIEEEKNSAIDCACETESDSENIVVVDNNNVQDESY